MTPTGKESESLPENPDNLDWMDISATNTQDQLLLKALQEFIIPHVGLGVDAKAKNDMDRRVTDAAAMKLIKALKEFISSVIGSSASQSKTTIDHEVDLEDNDQLRIINHVDLAHDQESGEGASVLLDLDQAQSSGADANSNATAESSVSDQKNLLDITFHHKVLQQLREHVFNTMPIRLLCFKPHGSHLQISLLERGAIYTHLASIMEAKMHDDDYRPIIQYSSEGEPYLEPEFLAIFRIISTYSGYAILSHTWIRTAPGEVTYQDWKNRRFDSADTGYRKLSNFCKAAWKDYGLTLGWMDTVCINKDSSSELDESIRSMYTWYERAKVCIIYLAETAILSNLHLDPWLTRGWTLQELLAPRVVKFYNCDWERFVEDSENDKDYGIVADQIKSATSITMDELRHIQSVSISRRMQLAATREVTRAEDTAYSLMGIFNISITTAYGEGAKRAFLRLLKEILSSKSLGIIDLFNWAGKQNFPFSEILPISPKQYLHRSASIDLNYSLPLEPFTLTHIGLCIPVLLMPGISIDSSLDSKFEPRGSYTATVNISISPFTRIPTTYHLLDRKISGPDGQKPLGMHQYTFAVLNVQQSAAGIFIPQQCIAIILICHEDAGRVTSTGKFSRIDTQQPVVFEMEERNMTQPDASANDHMVMAHNGIHLARHQIAVHGMQLLSKYL